MGLQKRTISLSSISKYKSLRLASYYELPKIKFPYIPFNECIDKCESGSRPKGGISAADYEQAISLGGEQIGKDGAINVSNLPYVSYEYYDKALKGKVEDEDILICKDGALTGKTCLVNLSELPTPKTMVNEHVYIVRANSKYRQQFLYYIMRTPIFSEQIVDIAYRKKAQPGLSSEHIKMLKLPEVPLPIQDSFLVSVKPITDKINVLKNNQKDIKDTIDYVFQKKFNFDYDSFEDYKSNKIYSSDHSLFSNNPDLRFSAKYHRPAGRFVMDQLIGITDKKIKHFLEEPIVLGASISPNDYDDNGDYSYISMATIKTWAFDAESASKVNNEYANVKSAKTVKKDDIILARSGEGTIGKVAIITDEDIQGIFADFTMKIRLQNYNPTFAYYYFRTMYFQYLIEVYKKGLGNNTNIFPIVIQEFPLPDISLDQQKNMVDEIQEEIAIQDEIKSQIDDLRSKIDDMIMKTII